MAHHLMDQHGTVIALPTVLPALSGPHQGHHWRLEELVERDGVHFVRATRIRNRRRCVITCLPEIFGLVVERIVNRARHVANVLHRAWSTIDEGLIMGVLALIPLALFEAYHGGEVARHILESLFNSQANTGGH